VDLVARGCSRLIESTWSPGKAAVLRRVADRSVVIGPGRPIVSFTFDDVPRTVVANAAPLLDEYGVKATFYVALGLAGEGRGFLDEGHVRLLAGQGHDIGCHTLTHYSLRRGSAEGLYEDALAGRRALESVLGGEVRHFAYPYGAINARAKSLLQGTFATMRTSTRGVNAGRVDLTYLRAENLYSDGRGLDLGRVRRRVRSVVERGGWLIFYTHGVRDDPGPQDSSCADFRRAVEIVMESGAPVMPVSQASAAVDPLRGG
jgi:peptidoglycan/xylan/chitin deacetylase (PgdA/CDA1 family)